MWVMVGNVWSIYICYDCYLGYRGLAYFGVALLILFVISLAIGVVLFVILRKIYEHMAGTGSSGGESGGFKKMVNMILQFPH